MGYWDIALMANDSDLQQRVKASAAQEFPGENLDVWLNEHIWQVTASPGWGEAWASAVAGGVANPGRDAGVITDGMILSAVQAQGA